MNLMATDIIPLTRIEDGGVRIAGTRVSLESVIYAFREGATPEEIVDHYSTLRLADVYTVIGYYLNHQGEVDEYVGKREEVSKQLQLEIESNTPSDGRRERLLARRANP